MTREFQYKSTKELYPKTNNLNKMILGCSQQSTKYYNLKKTKEFLLSILN